MINLFDSTARTFTTLGLGTLHPTKCEITRNLSGVWELSMEIPADERHAREIAPKMLLYATIDDSGAREPFEVVRVIPKNGGKIAVTACHVFYGMQWLIVAPFTAANLGDALDGLSSNLVPSQSSGYTLSSELARSTAGNFRVKVPAPLKTLLQGSQGSIVQTFGGEWRYSGWTARLMQRIGENTDVIVRAGKNLLTYEIKTDITKHWTGIVAVYQSEDATVYSDVVTVSGSGSDKRVKVVDATEAFDSVPTAAQLNAWAASYVSRNGSASTPQSIKFTFAALWQTEEYKHLAALERLSLGDSFRLIIPEYGIDEQTRLVETVYDERLNRYKSMTAGTIERNFVQATYQGIKTKNGL